MARLFSFVFCVYLFTHCYLPQISKKTNTTKLDFFELITLHQNNKNIVSFHSYFFYKEKGSKKQLSCT